MAKNKPIAETQAEETKVNDPAAVNAAPDAAPKGDPKSIVPNKYAGKYKNGGQGPTSDFVRAQCGEGEKFEYGAFFELCSKNGIPEDKIALYKGQVDAKQLGANGRARMTLGNMLRAKARKDQKLTGLNGESFEVAELALPKPEKKESVAA